MTKALLGLATALALTGCSTVEVTPLRGQPAAQIETDRAKCSEWAKKTALVTAGDAACMLVAGYAAPPGVRAFSEPVRLTRQSTPNELVVVLADLLDCDTEAKREAQRGFGTVRTAIRDYIGWSLDSSETRRQVFLKCLRPRGYDLAKK